jgi:hypothetical protein
MNKTLDSPADNISRRWNENLKDNKAIVVLVSVVIGLLVGYFTWQQQEEMRREQWKDVLSREIRNWLTERGRETTGSIGQGLERVRSATELAADKGAEYGRRLNPFRRETRRFFGIF